MAWAIAQLGWVAGPAVMVLFAFVNLYTSNLLAQCYRSGDPVTGQRNYTYMDAVKSYLGKNRLPIIFSWLNCHYNHEHDGEKYLCVGCRRTEGDVMWIDSILEFVWCCYWLYDCSISQHDVSFILFSTCNER